MLLPHRSLLFGLIAFFLALHLVLAFHLHVVLFDIFDGRDDFRVTLRHDLNRGVDVAGFADLEALPDRELADLAGALEMFEKSCSGRRHELFEQIDALTAELVGRLKSGGAGSLLAEG